MILQNAEAHTLRTRVGLEAKALHGVSSYIELENTWSLAEEQFFDGVSSPNGKFPIADPDNTELNPAYLQYVSKDFLGTEVGAKAKVGKQRIIFDDARFVGNLGWRQNEQTYDAVIGESDLRVDKLTVQYAHVRNVQRIFGDRGPTPATRDLKSDSHLARIHYKGIEGHDQTAFGCFLGNGGPTGLQDLFITVAPALPMGLTGKLVYHELWADEGDTHLGREVDGVVSRAIS